MGRGTELEDSARGWKGGLYGFALGLCPGECPRELFSCGQQYSLLLFLINLLIHAWASCLFIKCSARSTAVCSELGAPKLKCPISSIGYHCCRESQESIS